MCLAVPAKILSVKGRIADVDFGGINREVALDLVPGVQVGEYVLVHAGFAIQVLSEEEALETLALFEEMGASGNDAGNEGGLG